jgi:CDP-diacylglycerol pyrophosphatase
MRTLTALISVAMILAAPGCSTKAADTNSAVGTTSPAMTTGATQPTTAAQPTGATQPTTPGESTSAAQPTGGLGAPLPQSDGSGFTPPHDCGDPNDTKEKLWTDVKGRTKDNKGPNIAVVEQGGLAYALHNGNREGETYKYNLLVIPTSRVKGIECDRILNPKDVLNLWKYAWTDARKQFGSSEDVMLGVNSIAGRSHDQLHIHLTGFNNDFRKQLDQLNIPTDLNKWNDSVHALGDKLYRIVRVKSLDDNPFTLLQDYVAKKYQDRFDQSLAVVAGPKNEGFYLIATQGPANLPGQQPHEPDLKREEGGKTRYGSKRIDDLMYLG